ncbi:MAG: HYR domain-containing protein, partial [Cryomorphaceae bacterium]
VFNGFVWNNPGVGETLDFPQIDPNGGHPGFTQDWAVRRWTSPIDGVISISGDYYDRDVNCGNGVNVLILKNGEELLNDFVNSGSSVPYSLEIAVVTGDVIDFAIDPIGTDAGCDDTHFTANIGAVISADDNCSVTLSQSPAAGTAITTGTTTVTITATDGANLTNSCSVDVTVVDDTPPVISCPATLFADNDPGLCSAVVTFAATATDNCGSATVTYSQNSGTVFNVGTTTVTATADDGNGNTSQCSFDVVVTDMENPVVTGSISNTIIEACDQSFAPAAATTVAELEALDGDLLISDNCAADSDLSVTVSESTTGMCPWVITRTYQVTDQFSNVSSTFDHVITIDDTTPPVFNQEAADLTVECDGTGNLVEFNAWLSNFGGANASDNCGNEIYFNNYDEVTNGFSDDCGSTGSVTVTFTAVDMCGNESPTTATFTIEDTTDPTASNPADITGIQCIGDIPSPDTEVVIDEADNCGTVTVEFVSDVDNGGAGTTLSPYVVTRTYSITDACDNSINVMQDITVVDGTAPVVSCPSTIEVDNDAGLCSAVVSFAATATDNCNNVSVTYSPNSGSTFPVGTTTVTATADDGNGNTSQCSFDVVVSDNEAPEITCAPNISTNNDTGICGAELVLTPPGVTDNCSSLDNALDFDGIDDFVSMSPSGPANTIEFWMNSDVPIDGNPSTMIMASFNNSTLHYVVVNDFTAFITGETIGLNSGSGNISTNVPLNSGWNHIAITSNGVSYSNIYINGIEVATTINGTPSVFNVSSMILGTRASLDVLYNGKMDDFRIWNYDRSQAEIQANMNGGMNSEPGLIAAYTFEEGFATGNNTGLTSTADASGNSNDGTLNNFALTGSTSNWVSGNFESSVTLTNNALTTYPVGITTVTWTATDAAGNTATCDQIITVVDNEPPAITCPGDITQTADAGECAAIVTFAATATDNCGATVTYSQNSGTSFPVGTTTVTATATDAAGNTESCSFTVTIADTEAPVVSGMLTDVIIEGCDASAAPAAETTVAGLEALAGSLDISDNCSSDANLTVNSSDVVTGSCPTIITRTYTVTDEAGIESTSFVHVINVDDTTLPTASAPAAVSVQCPGEIPAVEVEVVTDEADNCGTAVVAHVGDVSNGGAGTTASPLIITRTYSVTDGCLNSINLLQFIAVVDDIAPVANAASLADVTAECEVASVTAPTATDNCVGTITGTTTTTFPITTQGTTTITWTFDDGNGNTSSQTQDVVIDDVTDPVAPTLADVTAECSATVPVPTTTDVCAGTVTGTTSDPLSYSGEGTYTVTWNFDDGNGNDIDVVQTVIIDDETDPVISSCPSNISVSNDADDCGAVVNFSASATDNCGGTPTITYSQDPGTFFPVGNTTVTVTADDGNGNTSTCSFEVTVDDTELPEISCLGALNVTVNQTNTYLVSGGEFDPTFSDNCSGATVSHNAAVVLGTSGPSNASLDGWELPLGTSIIRFTALDAAGNTSFCDVVINVDPAVISGNVTLNGACLPLDMTVSVYEAGTPNPSPVLVATFTNVEIAGDGSFSFDATGIAPGSYDIYIKPENYLTKFAGNYTVDGLPTNVTATALVPGDISVTEDDQINGDDLSLIIGAYNTEDGVDASYNSNADVNCDGFVDALDLSLLIFFFFDGGDSATN